MTAPGGPRDGAPSVSLILPNRNNEPVLDLFFETLARNTTHPVEELIVVDDGSTDRSVAVTSQVRSPGSDSGAVYTPEVVIEPHRGTPVESRTRSQSSVSSSRDPGVVNDPVPVFASS